MQTTIRAAVTEDARAIAAVHVASWRAAYRGIIDEEVLSRLSVEQRAASWRRILTEQVDHITYVAVDEAGEVIGFANGGGERDDDPFYSGELYAIYLLHEVQGMGIGRSLAQTVLADLHAQGHNTVLVWVLDDNPFKHFYAALGATPVRERNIIISGAEYRELGYGWQL